MHISHAAYLNVFFRFCRSDHHKAVSVLEEVGQETSISQLTIYSILPYSVL